MPQLNIYQENIQVLGGITQDPNHLYIYQMQVMVLGTTEVIPEPPAPAPSAPSGTQHIFYISGSSSRQGSALVSTSPLNSIKVQKAARLQQIPQDRFNDTKYYFS